MVLITIFYALGKHVEQNNIPSLVYIKCPAYTKIRRTWIVVVSNVGDYLLSLIVLIACGIKRLKTSCNPAISLPALSPVLLMSFFCLEV